MTIADEIKAQVNLEVLINETASVKLKKSGRGWVGFCPFHDDRKKPSLVVYPPNAKGGWYWKCFYCNDGGTQIDWVKKKNPGWDNTEAIKDLAKRAGIELRSDSATTASLSERTVAQKKRSAYRVAMDVFKRWLLGTYEKGVKTQDGDAAALSYAIDRGWQIGTIENGGTLGFSGRGTDAEKQEMKRQFQLHGVDLLSPEAVVVLGFRGDVESWATAHGLDPHGFSENYISGLMDKPALVYAHKFDGRIEYLSGRILPGFDEKRKSHNPNAELAGQRRPFRNSLYRHHHLDGQDKGALLYIVEGQGDAKTGEQFGVPCVALCGSSWEYLVESGEVAEWLNDYEEFIYLVDADAAGEKVVTGKDNKFELSNALGAMLWIGRTPKEEWQRPNGETKSIKDLNDLAQFLMDTKVDEKDGWGKFNEISMKAERIVVLAARYAGMLNGHVRDVMVEKTLKPMILSIPEQTRVILQRDLAIALHPNLAKSAAATEFNKWLKAQVKAAENSEGNDGELPKVETLGGWYPDETRKAGYLVDTFFDRAKEKLVLVWAHIKSIETGEREIGYGPYLELPNKKLIPPAFDENIFDGAVKMASALGEKMSSWDLVKKNANFYRKYFYMDDKSRYTFFGAWSLSTWVFDCFDQVVHLHARGGSGSGKSDLMYLVGVTSFRFAVTLAMSSTASYKGIRKLYQSTVMIDEVENIMKKDDGTMAAFLKGSAMKRYSRVMNAMEVMTPNGKVFVPTSTNVYGPVLLTGYKPFADDGIENRCMKFDLSQVDMFTLVKNKMEPGYYPPELEAEAEELRNLSLRWRLETWLPNIELSKEQMEKNDLVDPLVSARVNQVLRPMKVLAILQNDLDMFEDLKKMGRANFEDEMIRRSGSFEAMVLRAALAADIAADVALQESGKDVTPQASKKYAQKVKGYAELVKVGKLKTFGYQVRYILFMNLAKIVNELFDYENLTSDVTEEEKKKRKKTQSKTAGDICREVFRLPVVRTGNGFVVILDRDQLDIAKLRFGLNFENDYDPKFVEEDELISEPAKESAKPEVVQQDFSNYTPSENAVWLDRADEED